MNQFECQKSMGWTDNEWKLVSGVVKKKRLQNDGKCFRFLYLDTRVDMDGIHFVKFTSMLLSNSMPF